MTTDADAALSPSGDARTELARKRYQALFERTPLGLLMLNREGRTQEINPAAAAILGREQAGMVGKPFGAWLADEQRAALLAFLEQAFAGGEAPGIELRITTPQGTRRDVLLETLLLDNASREPACGLVISDLNLRRKADDAINLNARIIQSVAEGVMITDVNGIIEAVNPAFEKSTGYSAAEAIGRTPALLRSGRHDQDFYREMWQTLAADGRWQGEIWNRNRNGEVYPEWLSISAVTNGADAVTHYVGIFSDAHTQEFILERLHYLAYYDGLTGLPNRRLFLDRLNLAISHARRSRTMLAVMFIDIDHFKEINDSLGHKAGDGLLAAMADRMKGCLRDEDTLARMGGDEFTVLLPSIADADATLQVGRKFLDCFTRPFRVDAQALDVSASIGISIYPDDGIDADHLLSLADTAMYRVKASGRNGCLRHDRTPDTAPPPAGPEAA